MPVKTFFETLINKGAKVQSLLCKPYSRAGLHEAAGNLYRLNATLQLGEKDWNAHYGGDELVTKHLIEKAGVIPRVKQGNGTVRLEIITGEGNKGLLEAAHSYLAKQPKFRSRRK